MFPAAPIRPRAKAFGAQAFCHRSIKECSVVRDLNLFFMCRIPMVSIVPVAAHGDHGRVFAGLLLLFALGSAAAKLGDGERALYLECVAALLKDACDEFVGAGRRIAETNSTGGWLAVVGVFRKEAEKGKCDERTLTSIFRALGHVQKMGRDEDREREFAAARAALGTVSGAVAFIVEAA